MVSKNIRTHSTFLTKLFTTKTITSRVCHKVFRGSGEFTLEFGANLGMLSAVYLTRFPSSKFIAFEPDPITASFNVRNLAFNYANISHWLHTYGADGSQKEPWSELTRGGYIIVAAAGGSDAQSDLVFYSNPEYPSSSSLRTTCPSPRSICPKV